MLRYKQFVGHAGDIEASVNAWLEANEPDVSQMVQTVSADGSIALGFLFEESFRGQEMRLSAEHGIREQATMPVAEIPVEPLVVPMEPGMPQDEPSPFQAG